MPTFCCELMCLDKKRKYHHSRESILAGHYSDGESKQRWTGAWLEAGSKISGVLC